MTKKAPVIKMAPKDEKTTEEHFNEWKATEAFTMDVAIEQAKRIDTWVSMREDAKHFLERTPSIEEVNAMCAYEITLLEEMRKDLDGLTFEAIADKENDHDIYARHIIKPEDCVTIEDFFKAFLTYSTVKSWAQHVFEVHRTVIADGNNK